MTTSTSTASSAAPEVRPGPLLREWRQRRRLSQLDVSTRTGVSTRHLSCVETGRARPSRDLLLYLAEELAMPQRATNDMLLAAGFAPVYTDLRLDDPPMSTVRDVISLVLDGNDPNPTTVIDTRWNLLDANAAALWLTTGVAAALLEPPVNIARLSLHPEVLHSTQDPQLAALIDECSDYAPGADRRMPVSTDVVLPIDLTVGDVDLSFVSTVTSFGASRDVNLSELSIETLYPADESTRRTLAQRPWSS
jgi:transcriptional regulator with XRE-family HTH domain